MFREKARSNTVEWFPKDPWSFLEVIPNFPAGDYQVPCALIIGQRKESTDKKTSLNNALREHDVAVWANRIMLDLAIVIVNYRSWPKLEGCLSSLDHQKEKAEKVIVVDNRSDDGVLEIFMEKFPWVSGLKMTPMPVLLRPVI